MSKAKSNKKQTRSNYRLAVVREDSYEEKFALSLSKRNIFLAISFITLFVILITALVIFYTPIREYIPAMTQQKLECKQFKILIK